MTGKRRKSLHAMARAKASLGKIMAQDADDDRNNRPIFMLLAAELGEIWETDSDAVELGPEPAP